MDDAIDPWSKQAPTWDSNPGVVAYADAAFASLISAVPVGRDARVLDFGCGTGLLTERIAPIVQEVVAVDKSGAMIQMLADKNLPNVRFGVAAWTPNTIGADKLAANPFGLIVCSSVCAFLDDYPSTVAMLSELLEPGGYFVQWDWELDAGAVEQFGLSADGITQAIQNAGLETVSVATGFDIEFEGQHMRPLMGVGRRPKN